MTPQTPRSASRAAAAHGHLPAHSHPAAPGHAEAEAAAAVAAAAAAADAQQARIGVLRRGHQDALLAVAARRDAYYARHGAAAGVAALVSPVLKKVNADETKLKVCIYAI